MTRRRALVALAVALALAAPAPAVGQAPAAPRNPHVRLDGRACTSCHTTSSWSAVAFDHHATAFPLLGQHLTVPCAGCHDLKDFRGAPASCGSCHADPHRGDAGARCEQCHDATAWQNVSPQNAHARTRLPDLGVHAALRCDDCHRRSGAHPFTGQVTACVSCHRPAYDATSRPAHRTLGLATQCETCHQFTTWDGALFRQHDAIFGIYSGRHAGVWSSCATCHADPANFTVFTCTGCHGQSRTDASHRGVAAYQWESSACLTCHPGARPATSLEHDAIFPIFSGTHAGQWTACSACHSDPADRTVISCVTAGCHVRTTTDRYHDRIPGYAYVTAQCRSCHPDGRAGTFTAHDAIFPVFSG